MELLVADIARGDDENVPSTLRIAIEVRVECCNTMIIYSRVLLFLILDRVLCLKFAFLARLGIHD